MGLRIFCLCNLFTTLFYCAFEEAVGGNSDRVWGDLRFLKVGGWLLISTMGKQCGHNPRIELNALIATSQGNEEELRQVGDTYQHTHKHMHIPGHMLAGVCHMPRSVIQNQTYGSSTTCIQVTSSFEEESEAINEKVRKKERERGRQSCSGTGRKEVLGYF